MLSFTSSLSDNSEAFAVFVNEKYEYRDKRDLLPKDTVQKINSFLKESKAKKSEKSINSFDISEKQKCFIIKVKNKYESYFPQENGGSFYSYLKNFKEINYIDLYLDSLIFDKEKSIDFFSQFIFGFNLKSYTFNKYKTENKENSKKKVTFKIITLNKEKLEKKI